MKIYNNLKKRQTRPNEETKNCPQRTLPNTNGYALRTQYNRSRTHNQVKAFDSEACYNA